jgi:2-oxoisovalerate dehydrogenase E1 component beta subunit
VNADDEPVTLADAPAPAMTMIEAINDALDTMLERDPDVVLMGEDIGYFGGVFRCTAGLQKKHGKTRVFDTPINECGIIGARSGCAPTAAAGARDPVRRLHLPGLDQLVSEAARLRYRSAGEFIAPMTVRSPFGGGIFGGQTHSQSPEAMFTHVCGIKTVVPSTPHDAKGLLIAAIEDDDPVIFFEPKRIYNGPFDGYYDRPTRPWKEHPDALVPEGYYSIPLGKARIVREGSALTVLAYGTMVHVAEAVCREKGVDAEIIDLRTLVPLDIEAVESRWKRPANAWSCTRRRAPRASAPSSPRWCRSAASTTSRRRSSASPGSTPPIRTASNGPISRADPRRRSDRQAAGGLRDGALRFPSARHRRRHRRGRDRRLARQAGRPGQGRRPLADLMTDKATVEMESPVAGKVLEVAGEVGDVIAIGSPLVVLENEGGSAEPSFDRLRADRCARPVRRAPPRRPPRPIAPSNRPTTQAEPNRPRSSLSLSKDATSRSHAKVLASPRSRAAQGTRHRSRRVHPARAAASAMPTRRVPSYGGAKAIAPAGDGSRTKRSRSSACAAASPRTWPPRSATSRTSPTSRSATSPISRSCAPISTPTAADGRS